MAAGVCQNPDCTLSATGTCLLSHPDPVLCPSFLATLESTGKLAEDDSRSILEPQELAPVEAARRFHSGVELGITDALEIMRARYSHLVGLLGYTDAGKTCFLSSLYLMASRGLLPAGYRFAGSLTLQAFEDRARGLRKWEHGRLPKQLVDHTVLSDPRQPGLLHLALRQSLPDRRRFDLLFTDLPGEWSESLVQRSTEAERLRFLQRADAIILVVDGPVLMSPDRHVELQRMRYLADRIAGDVGVSVDTPVVVLVSKCDEIEMKIPKAAEDLEKYVRSLGFSVTLVPCAAFSRDPARFPNGTGVFRAVEAVLSAGSSVKELTTRSSVHAEDVRAFQRFGYGS